MKTLEQFGAEIKQKYPQYKEMSDEDVGLKVLAKYPSYQKDVTLGSSTDKQDAPKKGLLQKATDVVTSVFPGKKIGEDLGTGIATVLAGKNAEFVDQTRPTTKQLLGDGAKIGATIAGAALPVAGSVVGKAAQFSGIGAISSAGEAATQNASNSEIAKEGAIGGAVGAGVGATLGIAEKGFKALGSFLGKTGDKIQTSVIKPSQADIKDGFDIETIKRNNLGGSLKQTFEKTDTKIDSLTKELNAKLSQSNSSIDLNKTYDRTIKRLLGNKLESFGSNTQMENAIDKLREEIVGVSGKNGLVTIPEAQLVKRASGHFGAWTYGVPTPEATASQKVYNTFYNELKKDIEVGSPAGVKAINQEISKLIPVMNALIRRIPVAERNSALSLTDIISLTGAAIDPRALGISLVNLASKSGTVGNMLSRNAPKAGQSVSNVIKKSEPIIRTAIGR